MRIAIISVHGCPLLPPGGRDIGGMNIYLDALSRELGRRGHTVDIFTRWHDASEAQVHMPAPNVRVVHLDAGPRAAVPKEDLYPLLTEFLYSLEAFRAAAGVPYDIIFSHYWLSGWVGTLLARSWQRPHVTMFHTMGAIKNQARPDEGEPELRVAAEHRIVAQADRIITPSPQERQNAIALYAAPPERVEVIPCGVDLAAFSPGDRTAARRQLGLDPREKVLLFVGRLEPLKGLDLLVDTLPLLKDGRAPVRLVVVGGDGQTVPEQFRIEELAAELGVTDRITFAGSVPHAALPAYYRAADVLATPSFYESFGMAAVEAMACGVPVVASRTGGLQSTVRDGETGFLVPRRDPQAWADALAPVLASDALRDRLGKAGRSAAQQFAWPVVAGQVLALFDDVMALSAARTAAPVLTGRGFLCWAV